MPRRRTHVRAGIIATALVLALPGVAVADPGDLDHTFGGDGVVDVAVGATDIALAPGNGLWVGASGPHGEESLVAVVTRLGQNGQLEAGFGDAGQLFYSYPRRGRYPTTRLTDVAALPGGGVQIAGVWCGWGGAECGGKSRGFLARFDASGMPVLGFGDDGVIAPRIAASFGSASLGEDLSVHSCHLGGDQDLAIVQRWLPDGQRDRAFGDRGRATVFIPGPTAYRLMIGCGATADGGTLVATMDRSTEPGALRVMKLTGDGELDESYGDGGRATIADDVISAQDALVSSDGTALFTGPRRGSQARHVLSLTADGARDATFGDNGVVLLDLPGIVGAKDVLPAKRSDGSIAITGRLTGEPVDAPYVAMLTPAGDLDSSFGDGGLVTGYADGRPPSELLIDGKDRVVTANVGVVVRFRA